MLKAAAALAAMVMALTLGACGDDDDGGKTPSATFNKFDVTAEGEYYVNKDGAISNDEEDGYVFRVHIFPASGLTPYECRLDKYTGSESSVSIPEGVTYIWTDAFEKCESLTSVVIPRSVDAIRDKAFYECEALTTVTIPDRMEKILINAFYICQGLATVKYTGTKEQWKSIESEYGAIDDQISDDTSRVTVECKDGKIKWSESERSWVDAD